MRLEINLEKIAQEAKDKKDENISFQNYLNSRKSEEIDAIVKQLNEQITPNISCVDCGNCCMNLRPIASYEELSKFVRDEDMDKYKYAEGFACKHLNDKKCSIYLDRFEECKAYPYMDKDNYIARTHGVLQNYRICPIVYNIYEQLKKELAWVY